MYMPQLEWEAHICEYVSFISRKGRASNQTSSLPVALDSALPLLGPRFIPPSFIHIQKRNPTPQTTPDPAYLKPLNIVHPFYYPETLSRCPQCHQGGSNVRWNGWNSTGHREVHGIKREETAIGVQLRCTECEERFRKMGTTDSKEAVSKSSDELYCFVTTNARFWDAVEHWDLPGEWLAKRGRLLAYMNAHLVDHGNRWSSPLSQSLCRHIRPV